MLSPEERRAKKLRHLFGPNAENPVDINVCVFRVRAIRSKKHRYKVEKNAQQNHLTGVCLICEPEPEPGPIMEVPGGGKRRGDSTKQTAINVIIVEGGRRAGVGGEE